MIKYLFIIINSFGLFIYGLFAGDNGITVTSNIPANLVAGQEVTIELKVNKGGMSGFAKLQLELPEGITVKAADDKGANYNYNAGIAKWVWPALPMESEIIVSVTLFVESSASGTKFIASKYSYVENNVKQVVEMNPVEVKILPPGSDPGTPVATKTETPLNADSATVTTSTPVVNTGAEPAGNITVTRVISAGTTDNEFLITLKIKKDGTKGFARYSDDISEGIIVKAAKTDGGSFSVADGKIKFVWVNVPEKDELEISYTISGSTSNAVVLGGEYSYLEDNQSKKFKVPMETIAFQTKQIAGEEKKESKPVEVKDPEIVIPATVQSVEETVAKKLSESSMETTIEKKDGTMNYMVQVGAFTNANVTAQRLKRKFSITETIKSELHEGYSKFMIGAHSEYKTARNQRETMKSVNGVKTAFVVAYNQGKRITVQEALMITNQKWFK
ncbi:hypothetical protein CNR22_20830 [Sphingobacteriaceae bacterium]|nr:hypothetical protein CNR22_20830 [Sphingobacteriaceae bacterium]